ncbi:MAG TPA: MarC family protein [Acidobacteria bacterium]|nr:MarC family protein [Acidobacteriota bacterium]
MALAGFFAIMNPIANTPIFISVTAGDDPGTKRAVARRSLVVAFIVVAITTVAGNQLFHLFGITLGMLRITGGLLVFLIGFHMLQGSGSGVHTPSDEDVESSRQSQLDVAISPLAIPILAGPGTIATAMSLAAGGWDHVVVTLVAFAVICLVTYLFFCQSDRVVRFLGQNGLNVVTRLMGLIVASIGTGMVLAGLGIQAAH